MTRFVCVALLVGAPAFAAVASEWNTHLARARALERAGDIAGARAELASAMTEARRDGPESAAVAHVLDAMGAFGSDIGDLTDAATRFERSLRIWTGRLGTDDPALATIVEQLAAVYLEAGETGKAERLQLERWLARVAAADPASAEIPRLLQDLAALDLSQGQFAQAEARLLTALELVAQRGQSGSASQAVALNGLGMTYLRWKRFDDAIEALSPALSLWVKLKGAAAVPSGVTAYNLALAYEGAGRWSDAERQARQSLAALEASLGPDSLRVADVLGSYARLLRKMKRQPEAKPLEARASAILRALAEQRPGRYSVDVTELGLEARRGKGVGK